jgi:hypothetical protein
MGHNFLRKNIKHISIEDKVKVMVTLWNEGNNDNSERLNINARTVQRIIRENRNMRACSPVVGPEVAAGY